MTNMIQNAKDQVAQLVAASYARAMEKGLLGTAQGKIRGSVEVPKDSRNGDYTSNFALAGAKALGMRPRDLAQILCDHLDLSANYGSSQALAGQKIMVEFVSANPTGPMHMGNARGGVLGDTLANVLSRSGCAAWKEFYVNDAGNQIAKFAHSIYARCMQLTLGEENYPFPEEGYHGEDIKELARGFLAQVSGAFPGETAQETWESAMAEYGLRINIPKMQEDLRKYGIEWFLESELHNSGYVAETVATLTEKGWTYEKDGALWLNTTALLKEKFLREGKTQAQVDKLELKDDVLRRANGFYTYFAADIAYHRNKFEKRGFDKVINVWGADHHGHVARLQAALDGLGLDGSGRLVIVLMQLVNLLQDGKPVRMSKRTGKAIALHDLLDEISVDAARYYFNNRVPNSPLDFDLGLAVREDSENPVYYVQYAHARICSLRKAMQEEGASLPAMADTDVSLLSDEAARDLIKQISQYPEELRLAARDYDPSYINRYLVNLAARFHKFYHDDRIKGEAPAVRDARWKLADTVRTVLENGLEVIGVSAPERM